jgi:hypothetical protein
MLKYIIKKYKLSHIILFHLNNNYLTWDDVLQLWNKRCKTFNKVFTNAFKNIKYKYMLKFIPLTSYSLYKPLVIMCIHNSELPIIQNYKAYEKYMKNCLLNSTFHFWNLTKNTYLLCPCPSINKNYSTIQHFINSSTVKQSLNFWYDSSNIARCFINNNKPVYINTHGLGVAYLHLRFDKIYKYSYHLPIPFEKMNKITKFSTDKWYSLI